MRIILLASLAALTPIAAAHAQPSRSNGDHEQVKSDRSDLGHGGSGDGRRAKSGPSNRSHAERCRRAYKSYDPRTDRYSVGRGRARICKL